MKIDSRIATETKTVEVYQIDGQEFRTLAEANTYLQEIDELLEWTYFTIGYKPDLTEGRGFQRWVVMATKATVNSAIAYALKNLGDQPVVAFYQQSTPAWKVSVPENPRTADELSKILKQGRQKMEVVFIDDFGIVIDEPAAISRLH
ncbi:hypothetical protein LG293_17055 (plasmid) [Citricoccus nitrophenolicus]